MANSITRQLRNVYTGTDLAAVLDTAAIAKELKLSAEQKSQFEQKVKDVKGWLESDKERLNRFKQSPLAVLNERIPELQNAIPKDLLAALNESKDVPCSGTPPSGIYNACALDLLRRVGVWVAQGPGHRSAFLLNTDAAVDAVAGSAPVEAVMLTKGALHAARIYP